MTREQAIALSTSGFWESMTPREIATFQLFEPLLCMPFSVFHKAVQDTLGRPVFTHEFGSVGMKRLQEELIGGARPRPTQEDILNLIPEERRIIVGVEVERPE